ncbi:hypothetical protein [Roseovarius aestuariivivens]|uniref:hypothetical protein n=1 Tax=Roseovarius aestuariivivens TaxID=1888910 RepID=UPI001080A37E|nr:hypothetical protein [Roseovarius aestuariivivens]
MTFAIRTAALILMTTLALLPARAQETLPDAVFRDYDHMRDVLEETVMARRIADVMRAFGGSDEMTKEELADLEARVRGIYTSDFERVDLVTRLNMNAGWARELYAFSTGISYFYVMVLFHQRDDALVAVRFKFNTDPLPLLAEF